MNSKLKHLLPFTLASLFLFVRPLFADVSVSSDFKGMIVITGSSGEVTIVEQGEPVPPIPQGASVEVFNGSVMLATAAGDKVDAACLNHTIEVAEGASIDLACGETEGLLKVMKSTVQLTDSKGTQSVLNEGAEYRILAAGKAAAPATEAGDVAGGPAVGGDVGAAPPVDSRNVEVSPRT